MTMGMGMGGTGNGWNWEWEFRCRKKEYRNEMLDCRGWVEMGTILGEWENIENKSFPHTSITTPDQQTMV